MEISLTLHQSSALEQMKAFALDGKPGGLMTLEGYAGTGKEQPVSTTVQTPSGPRRFGDLQVGDEVIGMDGQAKKVVGVYPQGVKQVYRISFRDGTSTRCGAEHNWRVYSKKPGCKGRTVTTQQLIDSGLTNSAGSKFRVPLCEPVHYQSKAVPFDPYLIGILIGDGSLTGNSVQYTCGDLDKDINTIVQASLPSDFVMRVRAASGCVRVTISQPNGERKNTLKEYLRQLGLDVHSEEKFIPHELFFASVADRKSLLQGLMDSDGTSRGNRIGFSSSSVRLAKDVVTLVQSLGGVAIYKCIDRTSEGKGCEHCVNVRVTFNPFRCERKASKWKLSSKNPPARYITGISKEGFEEQMCIMVDAEDHLYLTDNFIVTHNTTLVGELIKRHGSATGKIAIAAPTNKAVRVLREKLGDSCRVEYGSIHSFLGLKMEELDNGDQRCKKEGEANLKEFRLAIVDECSMISVELFRYIIMAQQGCRVLFVGDPAQLPPVGDRETSPVFEMVQNKVTLSEVVRQAAENPIIRLSMRIREAIEADCMADPKTITESLPDPVNGTAACLVYGGQQTATTWALDEINRGRDARIIAFTNAKVQRYNADIHEARFGIGNACRFSVGETVMAHQAFDAISELDAKVGIYTSEELEIVDIQQDCHPYYPHVSAHKLVVLRDNGSHVSCHVADNQRALDDEVNSLFAKWRDAKSEAEIARKNGARQAVIQDLEAKSKSYSAQAWALRKAFAPIRHVYAITAHKSQGSTFDTALVDYNDLAKMRTAFDFNRALYVAVTRPRSYLAVVV